MVSVRLVNRRTAGSSANATRRTRATLRACPWGNQYDYFVSFSLRAVDDRRGYRRMQRRWRNREQAERDAQVELHQQDVGLWPAFGERVVPGIDAVRVRSGLDAHRDHDSPGDARLGQR